MQTEEQKEEIIGLIQSGFDLSMISLELDIPLKYVQECKRELKARVKKEKEKEQEEVYIEEKVEPRDYDKLIEFYKKDIEENNKKRQNKSLAKKDIEMLSTKIANSRNILAFAYSSAGRFDEARKELEDLISQSDNYTAYRQMVYLEKSQNNYEDAKIWAYMALDKYPESISIRKLLLPMVKDDIKETVKLTRQIRTVREKNNNHILEFKYQNKQR